MPIYDYQCSKCDAQWEETHGMNEEPTIRCPECGHSPCSRMITGGFGFRFKFTDVQRGRDRATGEPLDPKGRME